MIRRTTRRETTPGRAPLALALLACAGAALASAGCRGERSNKPPRQFFPDMDDQEKYKPQAESSLFADGRTMRDPPANTVAFGSRAQLSWGAAAEAREASARQVSLARDTLLKADVRVYTGKNEDGTYVETIPIPVTPALMRRGQERFSIFCTPCHGHTGDGQGMVGQQWSYVLPTFHDPKYDKGSSDPDGRGTDGFVFWTIRNGVPNTPPAQPPLKMPSYRSQVNEHDAWAIVAYFRALKRSHAYPADKVPEGMRAELERTRGATRPAAEPGQAAPAPTPAGTEPSR